MKKILFVFCLTAGVQLQGQQRYIFFLHNAFLEQYSLVDSHPEYGKCEYKQILEAFKKEGFIVLSEIRQKNTIATTYASRVAGQIDSLMVRGVKPGEITVIGTSKGGYIAQYVSNTLNNEKINYVFIGCCSKEDPVEHPSVNFSGNILSIYESSDVIGQSCMAMKNKSRNKVPHFKEIKLTTGLKHGFLFKASPLWMNPAVNWAKGNYN